MSNYIALGTAIKKMRTEQKISQEHLASFMHATRSTIVMIIPFAGIKTPYCNV